MTNSTKRIQPHIKAGRYYNFPGEVVEGFVYRTIHTYVTSLLQGNHKQPATIADWICPDALVATSEQPRITWLGHSTFLIQIGGVNILTDPIFGNASFLYHRILPVGIVPAQLPPIDYVLISHNHHDHMDAKSLMLLRQHAAATFLVPAGDKAWLDARGFERVQEFTWWQPLLFSTGKPVKNNLSETDLFIGAGVSGSPVVVDVTASPIKFTFLPAHHWSQRGLFDKNKSLWGSWMLQCGGYTIYFAGDTAYADHFTQIADAFPVIDVALMPIGPCLPRAWMSGSHVGPQEAGQAFLDLNAHHFIPMHWGTYAFGVDAFDTPVTMLAHWWAQHQTLLGLKQLHLLPVGKACSPAPMATPFAGKQPVTHL